MFAILRGRLSRAWQALTIEAISYSLPPLSAGADKCETVVPSTRMAVERVNKLAARLTIRHGMKIRMRNRPNERDFRWGF
jgi:hypothetical protein